MTAAGSADGGTVSKQISEQQQRLLSPFYVIDLLLKVEICNTSKWISWSMFVFGRNRIRGHRVEAASVRSDPSDLFPGPSLVLMSELGPQTGLKVGSVQ